MKISTKGRYALLIMIYLAKHYKKDEFVSLNSIATDSKLSIKYLEKIMSILNKTDFFITSRGIDGGYKLARSPKEYIVGDIIRTAEGDIAPVDCVKDNNNCISKSNCTMFKFWNGLNIVINDYLNSKTLEDLI